MKNLPGFWKAAFEIFVELSISERVNNSRLSKWYKYTIKPWFIIQLRKRVSVGIDVDQYHYWEFLSPARYIFSAAYLLPHDKNEYNR